jgi:hypothetical protein
MIADTLTGIAFAAKVTEAVVGSSRYRHEAGAARLSQTTQHVMISEVHCTPVTKFGICNHVRKLLTILQSSPNLTH